MALWLFLQSLGFGSVVIGIVFAATLFGDLVITSALTTHADAKIGRKSTLIVAASMMAATGIIFACVRSLPQESRDLSDEAALDELDKHGGGQSEMTVGGSMRSSTFWLLLITGFLGVLSPTGGETGAFLAVEQSSLQNCCVSIIDMLPAVYTAYQLMGYLAQGLGALAAGWTVHALKSRHEWSPLAAYRFIMLGYAFIGLLKVGVYLCLSNEIEPLHVRDPLAAQARYQAAASSTAGDVLLRERWYNRWLGLKHRTSVGIVARICALFGMDAFAGGFAMQTIIVFWFRERWSMHSNTLGELLMACNFLAGFSALLTGILVARMGSINTLVISHLPSNLFLLLVPLMPNPMVAFILMLVRFSLSQSDGPARATYIATILPAEDRAAATGLASIARSVALALSPLLAGVLLATPSHRIWFAFPFFLGGGLKCLYDIILYVSFQSNIHARDTPGSLASTAAGAAEGEGGASKHPATVTKAKVGVTKEDVLANQAHRQQQNQSLYDEEAEEEEEEAFLGGGSSGGMNNGYHIIRGAGQA